MDVHNEEQRSRNMRAIKSSGTKAEVLLAKGLWKKGYRYRKNNTKVFGKPDLTFAKARLAIFVDGEFFHGKDWETKKFRIKSNRDFWWPKIEGNIKRDQTVNEVLLESNWSVIRFWVKDITENLPKCIYLIETTLTENNAKF